MGDSLSMEDRRLDADIVALESRICSWPNVDQEWRFINIQGDRAATDRTGITKPLFKIPNTIKAQLRQSDGNSSIINSQANSELSRLPTELLTLIFDMCDDYDDLMFMLTCKRFLNLTTSRKGLNYDLERDGDSRGAFISNEKRFMLANFLLRVGPPRVLADANPFRPCSACLSYRPCQQSYWKPKLTACLPESCCTLLSRIMEGAVPRWQAGKLPECPECMLQSLIQLYGLLKDKVHNWPDRQCHVRIDADLDVVVEHLPSGQLSVNVLLFGGSLRYEYLDSCESCASGSLLLHLSIDQG